jgi:hypothetical protein
MIKTCFFDRDMSAEEKKKIRRERASLKQHKQEMYSLWCNELYKLSIANKVYLTKLLCGI